MQLAKLSIDLVLDEPHAFRGYALNPWLQGWLLEQWKGMDPDLTEGLHGGTSGSRAYSQGAWPIAPGRWRWEVSGLTTDTSGLVTRLHDDLPQYLSLRPHDPLRFRLELPKLERTTYSQLLLDTYRIAMPRPVEMKLSFLTPTAFRVAQTTHMHPLPDPRLILQSALNRWNAHFSEVELAHPELLEDLASILSIDRFQLRSGAMTIHGRTLPGCLGDLQVWLRGSMDGRRLAHLLLQYLSWSGVGAKTAMGMGRFASEPVVRQARSTALMAESVPAERGC